MLSGTLAPLSRRVFFWFAPPAPASKDEEGAGACLLIDTAVTRPHARIRLEHCGRDERGVRRRVRIGVGLQGGRQRSGGHARPDCPEPHTLSLQSGTPEARRLSISRSLAFSVSSMRSIATRARCALTASSFSFCALSAAAFLVASFCLVSSTVSRNSLRSISPEGWRKVASVMVVGGNRVDGMVEIGSTSLVARISTTGSGAGAVGGATRTRPTRAHVARAHMIISAIRWIVGLQTHSKKQVIRVCCVWCLCDSPFPHERGSSPFPFRQTV